MYIYIGYMAQICCIIYIERGAYMYDIMNWYIYTYCMMYVLPTYTIHYIRMLYIHILEMFIYYPVRIIYI